MRAGGTSAPESPLGGSTCSMMVSSSAVESYRGDRRGGLGGREGESEREERERERREREKRESERESEREREREKRERERELGAKSADMLHFLHPAARCCFSQFRVQSQASSLVLFLCEASSCWC